MAIKSFNNPAFVFPIYSPLYISFSSCVKVFRWSSRPFSRWYLSCLMIKGLYLRPFLECSNKFHRVLWQCHGGGVPSNQHCWLNQLFDSRYYSRTPFNIAQYKRTLRKITFKNFYVFFCFYERTMFSWARLTVFLESLRFYSHILLWFC